jgi:integrase
VGVYDRNKDKPGRPANWWIDYYVGAERVREPGCGRNKTASERLHTKRMRQIADGTWKRPDVRGEDLTVEQYAERWSALRESEGIKTQSDYDSRVRDYLVPEHGGRLLNAIERQDIKTLITELVAKGELAPRTVLHVYGAFRALFARALEDGLIIATPCTLKTKKGELPPKKDKNPRWRHTAIYSPNEAERLMFDERIPWNRRVFYGLMFMLGARFGEAAGRKWLDWDRGARPLSRMVVATQYDDEPLKSPTGDAPTRHVPVHPTLEAVLVDWHERGFALTYGREPEDADWIVPSLKDGRGLRTVRNGLKRLVQDCEEIGIRPRTQHDARRTMFTVLRELGVDERLASTITHGASVGDTASHYEVWRWPVLCEAVSRLPISAPVNRSHIGHTLGLGAAKPPVSRGNLGGADGTRRSGPGRNAANPGDAADSQPQAIAADCSPSGSWPAQPDTSRVTTIGGISQASRLRAAADALRSGRVDRITAEWRAELAQACEDAADDLTLSQRPDVSDAG